MPNAAQVAAIQLTGAGIASALDPEGMAADALPDSGTAGSRADVQSATDALHQMHMADGSSASKSTEEGSFQTGAKASAGKGGESLFNVERDGAWLSSTRESMHPLLAATVPGLCHHSAASVRAAVASAVADVLAHAACTVGHATLNLLAQTLLLLSQDASPSVCKPCQLLLSQTSRDLDSCTASGGHQMNAPSKHALSAMLQQMLPELQSAFTSAHLATERTMCDNAARFAACLAAVPPATVVAALVSPAAALQSFVASLATYFQIDEQLAGLWLHGHSAHGQLQARLALPALGQSASQQKASQGVDQTWAEAASSYGTAELQANAHSHASTSQAGKHSISAKPRAKLRSMPLGLKHVHSEQAYKAVASVPQALGAACAEADLGGGSGGMAAIAVVDELRRTMESAASCCQMPYGPGQPPGVSCL